MRRTGSILRLARNARRSSRGFPPLTWARCECGCGWEGEDPVTQFLIEEAAFLVLEERDARLARQPSEEDERYARLVEMANRVTRPH